MTVSIEKKKDYFSSREAAKLLGVAVSTIQLWVDSGLLRAWLTGGGHRRIACDSVKEMLKRQQEVANWNAKETSLSVIVVEDDAQQRRLYEKQITGWEGNANVITAKDGYEGLIKIGQALPDVIISDLMMPNIDGFQMVKVLKEIPELESCLIIVISGLDEDEILKRGGLPDGVHFFKKPAKFEELEVLLKKKMDHR